MEANWERCGCIISRVCNRYKPREEEKRNENVRINILYSRKLYDALFHAGKKITASKANEWEGRNWVILRGEEADIFVIGRMR